MTLNNAEGKVNMRLEEWILPSLGLDEHRLGTRAMNSGAVFGRPATRGEAGQRKSCAANLGGVTLIIEKADLAFNVLAFLGLQRCFLMAPPLVKGPNYHFAACSQQPGWQGPNLQAKGTPTWQQLFRRNILGD